MKQCKITIKGLPTSPYSQSAKYETPVLDRESADDYDTRTWRDHCTVNSDGIVCIPSMAIKQGLDRTAQKLAIKVPGRRGATFKSFFQSGVFCNANAPIKNGQWLKPEDGDCALIYANADGVRGSGKRVWRRFPAFHDWHALIECVVVDDIITNPIFEQTFKAFGIIVGIGRFRPENGGINGRFRVEKFEWEDLNL